MFPYVHMKPHAVLFTDVSNFIDGIKSSIDGGTSSGIHKHRNIPLQIKSIEKRCNTGLKSSCYILLFPDIVDIKDKG